MITAGDSVMYEFLIKSLNKGSYVQTTNKGE